MPRWTGVLAATLMSSGCIFEAQTRSDAFSVEEEIVGVVVNVGAGDLEVIGTSIEGAEIFQQLEWSGREPDSTISVQDGILTVSLTCRAGQLVCRADHELIVPEGAWLQLETGSGELDIKGTDADIAAGTGAGSIVLASASGFADLETGSGDVLLMDVAGDIVVSTGSGLISGSGLAAGLLQANTGSGDVELSLSVLQGGVDISTGSGDVELAVPRGSYAVDVSTGAGKVRVDGISDDPGAPRWIEVDTGSGDVHLEGN